MLFLSIAIGSLLVKYFGYDFSLVISSFGQIKQTEVVSNLSLQFLPVGLTIFFLRKSVPASKFIFHLVPLALSCGALGVLSLPLLSDGTEAAFKLTSIGSKVEPMSDLIVGAACITVLAVAWLIRSTPHHGKKHH